MKKLTTLVQTTQPTKTQKRNETKISEEGRDKNEEIRPKGEEKGGGKRREKE